MNIYDDDEYGDETTGFFSQEEYERTQSEEYQRQRQQERERAEERFNNDMRREFLACFSSSSPFAPSGEMAALSFMQDGSFDDEY